MESIKIDIIKNCHPYPTIIFSNIDYNIRGNLRDDIWFIIDNNIGRNIVNNILLHNLNNQAK